MTSKTFRLWLLGLFPLVCVLAGILFGFVREYRAWAELKQDIAAVFQEHEARHSDLYTRLATQSVEAESSYRKQRELDAMATVVLSRASTYDLNALFRQQVVHLKPGESWPEEPLVKHIVDDTKPLLDLAEALLQERAHQSEQLSPVGSGYYGSLERLLNVYFQYSYYHRDSEQAKRALVLLSELTFVDHPEYSAVGLNNQLNGIYQLYSLLGSSLASDVWSDAELVELSDHLLGPLEIPNKLSIAAQNQPYLVAQRIAQTVSQNAVGTEQSVLDLERGFNVDSVQYQRLLAASRSNHGLRSFADLAGSFHNLKNAKQAEPLIQPTGVFAVDLAGYSKSQSVEQAVLEMDQLAYGLMALEDIRRAIMLAITLKRFEISEGHWPITLEELASKYPKLELRLVQYRSFNYYFTTSAWDKQIKSSPEAANSDAVFAVIGSFRHAISGYALDSVLHSRSSSWLRDYYRSQQQQILIAPSVSQNSLGEEIAPQGDSSSEE